MVRLERRGGFGPLMPAALTGTLHEVKAQTNSIVAWMDDCGVQTLTDCTMPKERVFEHYRAWCAAGGPGWRCLSRRAWGRGIRWAGYQPARRSGISTVFSGARIWDVSAMK